MNVWLSIPLLIDFYLLYATNLGDTFIGLHLPLFYFIFIIYYFMFLPLGMFINAYKGSDKAHVLRLRCGLHSG